MRLDGTASSRARVQLLDATLREGEQQSGVRFTGHQKAQLVRRLEEFGVDLIEVGHPGISAADEEICRVAGAAARTAEILMHARVVPDEVRAAHRAGAHWVGLWASVNEVSLAAKFSGRPPAQIAEQVRAAVTQAKELGLRVRFTIEDASRTARERIREVAQAALAAGADRISLADTTGVWEPAACAEEVAWAVTHLGGDIEVHLHNDLGLAAANALAAIDAGASVVDASVLGIGERAGIVDLLQLAVLLKEKRRDDRFRLEQIPRLAQSVETATGFHPDALRPVTGKNAFTHTARYHTAAVRRLPAAYEPYPPEAVGRERRLVAERPDPGRPAPATALIVGKPFVKGASELKYHRDGPGVRWVQMDSRVDPRTSLYMIQRTFGHPGDGQGVVGARGPAAPNADLGCPGDMQSAEAGSVPEVHVDPHTHHCDSLFVFWGDQADGTGLTCRVRLGEEEETVCSPASVFIPAGVEHAYHYLLGCGTYTNIVLAPDYNSSLEDGSDPTEAASRGST